MLMCAALLKSSESCKKMLTTVGGWVGGGRKRMKEGQGIRVIRIFIYVHKI